VQVLLPVEKHVETQKETEKGKENEPSSGSAVCQQQLLDEATLKSLDKSSKFLYNLLLTVCAIEIKNSGLFRLDGEDTTWLLREDIIDIFTDDSLSITMMRSFCM
jgi:hypothetical protein